MDHPLSVPLRQWLHARHQALLEQVMGTWQEGLAGLAPDEALIAALERAMPAPPPAAPAQPVDDDGDVARAMDLLEGAATQGEVLQKLLDALTPFADRNALFIIKQGLATLFSSRGFDAPRNGTTVVPPPELEALIQGHMTQINRPGPAYAALLGPLSGTESSEFRILPLRIKRKTVAVLLADAGLRGKLSRPGHLRALAHSGEACLSYLSGAKDDDRASTSTGSMPMMEAPPSVQTQRIPDPIQTAPPPAEDLDPKVRAAAERLARVLAGDVELYFPQKVEQARQAGNLYTPLREELERSRHTFIERFGQDLEVQHRIFHKALVDLLCQGNPDLLKGAPWAP